MTHFADSRHISARQKGGLCASMKASRPEDASSNAHAQNAVFHISRFDLTATKAVQSCRDDVKRENCGEDFCIVQVKAIAIKADQDH